MADFTIKDDLMYDTKTGSAFLNIHNENGKELFAVVVMGGHCGNGYFIPHMLNIAAACEEDAINSAMKAGRVKKNAKNKILACSKINHIEFRAIEHINDCDPYHYAEDNRTNISDLEERRIVVEGAKDWRDVEGGKKFKRKVSIDEIKTADMYDDKYVLQRYFAPYMYGDKLVYPRKVNFRDMLDEFLYYNTIEIGIKRGKIHALSYYYQLYGENNNLNIKYGDGVLSYTNQFGEEVEVVVSDFMKEHLDKAKQQFVQIKQEENVELKKIKMMTQREKHFKRYEKYMALKNKMNNDEDERQ